LSLGVRTGSGPRRDAHPTIVEAAHRHPVGDIATAGKDRGPAGAYTGVMTSPPRDIHDDVVGWRRRRLCRAGFEPALADAVARDCAMDLHALLGLVDRGCPPALAARILAPLDHAHRPC
jgi:hypothetical protein